MGIVIDIILLAILMLTIFMGYKKGLVKVIFKVFAFLVALIVTIFLYKPVTNIVINNTELDEKIANIIIEKGTVENDDATESNSVDKYIENTKNDIQNGIVNSAAVTISVNLVSIIVMIALFIVVRVALIFVGFFANSLAELPIVKQFNKAGGIAYGALQGIVIILAILAIIYFISSTTKDSNIVSIINTSFITKIIYYNNPILNIIF
jgi:lysylphosphatidylglycerol synthetase-like protein (DUF2156 family)